MIGEMVRYAANRAMGGVVESAMRKASWGGVAVFLLVVGAVFTIIAVFRILDIYFGPIMAGIIMAVGCFVLGAVCLMMPRFLDWLETPAKPDPGSAVSETVSAVQDEVSAAVDYFGPIRVVGSGFLMGLGIARKLKR